ncbi:hypothetical protein EDB85DRAFT_1928658 [Lactarius pseudohatsudake]|nr:hypothetical protein EDB85DRAFT_1928658 [Lactarius pseudohatsudake]
MVVFTFANSQKGGGYYIASTRSSMGWQGLPHDLANTIEDVRNKGEAVEEVSVGLDGDWFLRSNARHACKTQHNTAGMVSNVELFAQLAAQGGLNLEQYAIQCFTFVPDSSGYVTVLHKGDQSLTRCAWHNVPAGLDQLLEREAGKGVRHVTAGMGGSYVVILNSGIVWWEAVPLPLNRLLSDAETRGRGVKTVELSLVAPDWFFIEFADGATQFVLPPTCVSQGPTMVSAFNRPTPSAPHPPLPPRTSSHGSHGSFSPLNSPNPSLGPVPGPPPYTPHQYVPMYAGPPQFAPQPPPQFAPQPPSQPTYHITNVYNNMQQQQQPPAQENSTFQLLGGALKVAGAVLPMLTGGVGLGTGFGS